MPSFFEKRQNNDGNDIVVILFAKFVLTDVKAENFAPSFAR